MRLLRTGVSCLACGFACLSRCGVWWGRGGAHRDKLRGWGLGGPPHAPVLSLQLVAGLPTQAGRRLHKSQAQRAQEFPVGTWPELLSRFLELGIHRPQDGCKAI